MNVTPEFIPKFPFTITLTRPAVTLTPSATTGNINLTASGSAFTVDHVNQYAEGNYGRARITDIVSATVVKAIVIVPFFDTSAIASQAWFIESGYEDVWSDDRGWPVSACFYQDRLVFGGAKSLPNLLALSRVGRYLDFDPGQALDDDAIVVQLSAKDEVPAIFHVMPDRHLQLFAAGAEYYIPVSSDTPLTPRNVAQNRTTARGIKRELRPVNFDGVTIYGQKGGKAYREFVFTGRDASDAYESPNLSLVWSHIVDDPVDVAIRPSLEKDDADEMLSVNADGTMSVTLRMREHEINGAAPWDTDGLFDGVGCVDDDIYAVVDREVGASTVRYLEFFDADLYLDCAVSYTSGTTLTGLSHLEGLTVKVRADGAQLLDRVVSGGQITIERAVVADAQVGLYFTTDVETLDPVKSDGPGAARMDGKTRISRIMVDVVSTQNLIVQGQRLNFRQFGAPIDDPPPTFTGRKIIDGLLGWEDENSITMTQDAPAPMTVKALEFKLRG